MFSKDFDPQNKLMVKGNQQVWGINIPDGTGMILIESASVDRVLYEFERFSIPKVYLEIAKNSEKMATEIISSIKQEKVSKRHIKLGNDENGSVWKYFSYLFTAIIFSYMALEAHVNAMLPEEVKIEDYINIPALSKLEKNSEILILKSEIEKQCSLYEKIFEVLPGIKHFDSNKLNQDKDGFSQLLKLRNILVHLKDKDIRTGMEENGERNFKKIWNILMPRFNNKNLRFYPHNVSLQIIDNLKKLTNKNS